MERLLDYLAHSRCAFWYLAALAVAANLAVVCWPTDDGDRECYLAFMRMAEALRSDDLRESPPQRKAMTAAAIRDLAAILEQIEAEASPSEPIKQQLLWAGRDHLMPALEQDSSVHLSGMKRHMDAARYHLSRSGSAVPEFAAPE